MRPWVMVVVVVLVGTGACSSDVEPAGPDARPDDLRLVQPRAVHRATLLDDGRVLITGGCTEPGCGGFEAGRTSEILDPDEGSREGATMGTPRASGTATLLPDGRVLLSGGYPGEGQAPTDRAEVYEPESGRFVPVGDLGTGRADHSASLLPDGRVLVSGGFDGSGRALSSTEIFDPSTDEFTRGPTLATPRAAHVAVQVGSAVLLIGGTEATEALATTEVFEGEAWRAGPSLRTARVKLGAASLGGGRVWVVGGAADTEGHERLATTEVLDLRRGTVSAGPELAQGEYKLEGAVVALADRRVVVPVADALAVFDPIGNRLVELDVSTYASGSFRTVTPLTGGRVLVAGGYDDRIVPTSEAVVVRIPQRVPSA